MKPGDEVLIHDGNSKRRRRFTIISVQVTHVIVEDRQGLQILLKPSDLQPQVADKAPAGQGRRGRKDSSVWMVFVPWGGQASYRRSPRRHV